MTIFFTIAFSASGCHGDSGNKRHLSAKIVYKGGSGPTRAFFSHDWIFVSCGEIVRPRRKACVSN